jgi:predicted nucleotide-binding protein
VTTNPKTRTTTAIDSGCESVSCGRASRVYLQKRSSVKQGSDTKTEGKVFIGHGRSAAWRDLKDLLVERLGLTPDEFNLESAAGLATTERLQQMLESASFAFLVMTAEDEHADSTRHARENVIHEAGLFQAKLGFRRAIVLLEEGCAEFSNITGLGHIKFPKGNLRAASEEIRKVLEREGLLAKKGSQTAKSVRERGK